MNKLLKSKNLIEFLRYVVVGGLAFVVDFIILYIFREFVFQGNNTFIASIISVAVAFVIAFIVNYVVSLWFVFNSEEQKKRGKNSKSFIKVLLIAIVGFLLTEILMYIGEFLLNIDYRIVKIIVSGIVLIWNYIGRKVFVFK